jgi:hypothetical protein
MMLLAGLASCAIRYEKEKEDNGSPQTAMVIRSGRQVKANSNSESDIDMYRIMPGQRPFREWQEVVDQNGEVALSVTLLHDKDIDLMINIYRDNRVVKTIDDSPQFWSVPGEEGVVNLYFPASDFQEGRILVSIERTLNEGVLPSTAQRQYTLDTVLSAAEADGEREPNDKMVQATPMSVDRLARGFFDPVANSLISPDVLYEVDWYSFDIPTGRERHIVHMSLTAVPNVDSTISLYDELGYLIRTANSSGIGEMERLMSIGLAPGRYYIRTDTNNMPQKNRKVGYLLRIELGEEQNSEYEPNDRYIFANDVEFSKDIYGYFNPLGDVDWFQMSVYEPKPQVLSIRISPTEYIDPVIELYSSSEELIRTANDRGIDEGEIIKNIGVEEGIYYIKVYNQNPERDNPERQYTLLVEKHQWQEDEEFEINDYLETANSIIFNGLKRGYITPLGDRDVYTFDVLQEGSSFESNGVTLELSPCVLIDIAMRVYDGDGVFIEEINNNPAEEGEKETLYLDGGSYFVEVLSMNQRENARDAYILRIY